jgi:hypothetical protein
MVVVCTCESRPELDALCVKARNGGSCLRREHT